MIKQKLILITAIATCITLSGCSGEVDRTAIRSWVQSNVDRCGAKVSDVMLVKEGLFSYKYVGFATITLGDKSITPEITAYSDNSGNSFQQIQGNPCAILE